MLLVNVVRGHSQDDSNEQFWSKEGIVMVDKSRLTIISTHDIIWSQISSSERAKDVGLCEIEISVFIWKWVDEEERDRGEHL